MGDRQPPQHCGGASGEEGVLRRDRRVRLAQSDHRCALRAIDRQWVQIGHRGRGWISEQSRAGERHLEVVRSQPLRRDPGLPGRRDREGVAECVREWRGLPRHPLTLPVPVLTPPSPAELCGCCRGRSEWGGGDRRCRSSTSPRPSFGSGAECRLARGDRTTRATLVRTITPKVTQGAASRGVKGLGTPPSSRRRPPRPSLGHPLLLFAVRESLALAGVEC